MSSKIPNASRITEFIRHEKSECGNGPIIGNTFSVTKSAKLHAHDFLQSIAKLK